MEDELYKKYRLQKEIDIYIYKMAQERDEDSKDVKTGSVIKDKNRKLVTDCINALGRVFQRAADPKGK